MKGKLILVAAVCLSLTACKAHKQEPVIQQLPPSPVTSQAPANPEPSLDISVRITPDATPTAPATSLSVAKEVDGSLDKFSKQRYALPGNLSVELVKSKNNIDETKTEKDSKTGDNVQIEKQIDIIYPQLTGFTSKDFESQLNSALVSKISREDIEEDGMDRYYYKQKFQVGHTVNNVCQIDLNTYKLIDGQSPIETTTSVSFDCVTGQLYNIPTAFQLMGYNSIDVLNSVNTSIEKLKDEEGNPVKKLDKLPNRYYTDDSNNLVIVYEMKDSKTETVKLVPLTIVRKG